MITIDQFKLRSTLLIKKQFILSILKMLACFKKTYLLMLLPMKHVFLNVFVTGKKYVGDKLEQITL